MALTTKEKNALLLAKYANVKSPLEDIGMSTKVLTTDVIQKSIASSSVVESATKKQIIVVPTTKSSTVKIKPKRQYTRRANTEIPDNDVGMTLARKSWQKSPTPIFRDNFEAQFSNKETAEKFVSLFSEGKYILDGFSHMARVPCSVTEQTTFISLAKQYEASRYHIYRDIVN